MLQPVPERQDRKVREVKDPHAPQLPIWGQGPARLSHTSLALSPL